MPHKQGGNNKVCQAHPPLHTVYAAVGCGARTAGRFGLSSCHNSPLVRHFTRVSLLCEKILGYKPIIHGMDRNASTPLQKQAARALPYPCRGAFYMLPRADASIRPYPFFTRPWHRRWTARGRSRRRRCRWTRHCWTYSNHHSYQPTRHRTFPKFHDTDGSPW